MHKKVKLTLRASYHHASMKAALPGEGVIPEAGNTKANLPFLMSER